MRVWSASSRATRPEAERSATRNVCQPGAANPACANAACHFHPATQRVLGTLDIGLSNEATLSSLASIRVQMLLFSILTLILATAGVIALLKMIVLIPLQRLQKYTETIGANSCVSHPKDLPYELDKIAKSYYFIKNQLETIEQQSIKAINAPDVQK